MPDIRTKVVTEYDGKGVNEAKRDIGVYGKTLKGVAGDLAQLSTKGGSLKKQFNDVTKAVRETYNVFNSRVKANGLEGTKKDLESLLALTDRLKNLSTLGLALGKEMGLKPKQMSGLSSMKDVATKYRSVYASINRDIVADEKAKNQAIAQEEKQRVAQAKATADEIAKAERERARVSRQIAQETAKAEREATKIREAEAKADAMRNSPYAFMARNAYSQADFTTLQGIQNFKNQLTNIKAYQDASNARSSIAEAVKSGDIGTAIRMMSQLENATKQTTQATEQATKATKELDKAQKETASSAQKMSSSHKGVLGTLSNLFSSLKRIAKLRLLRGIIRGITQSISEGTANLYQYSAAMNSADSSSFSGNMDMMASLLAQLTNAIGTVAGQLMANLAPALSTIANWFITAANAAAQFLAALGGRATYTRAKTQTKAWKDVGGAVGGATAAAKEYKNTIMGFDEINALNDPSSGGGGGGGGGASAPDYSDMFEEVPLERTGLMGALNRLGELLHPILEELGNEIEMWVDSTVSMIEGGIDIIDGLLNNDKEKIKKGIKEVQHAFEENEMFWLTGSEGVGVGVGSSPLSSSSL